MMKQNSLDKKKKEQEYKEEQRWIPDSKRRIC